jgi:hypothetical protein
MENDKISLFGDRGNGVCYRITAWRKRKKRLRRISLLGERGKGDDKDITWRRSKWRMTRISLLGERGNGD